MKTLTIADDLQLPLEAVTEKLAFLGRTGTGKTYAAMKLAELMLEAGAQIVALDFVGKWYGLRVPGAGDPFSIPVFGGLQGDYPLEPTGGALVADLIVDRAISAVLDVSQFTRAEQIRFCLAFAQHFFQRKKAAPSAVHLFLEECQEVLPQNAGPNEAEMLGAFERVWKLGRNFGIGGSLISQRPQEVNKKALNMSGTLFVFQMTGPQERKTIEQWVSAQGINEDIAEILPKLQEGQPHVWSVALGDVSQTVRIAEKRTADVSATPSLSPQRKERPLTPIDVPSLTQAMAATVERAKENDPRELRKQLADLKAQKVKLEREVEQAKSKTSAPAKGKDVSVLTGADRELLKAVRDELAGFKDYIGDRADTTLQAIADRSKQAIDDASQRWTDDVEKRRALWIERLSGTRLQRILDKVDQVSQPVPVIPQNAPVSARSEKNIGVSPRSQPSRNSGISARNGHPAAAVGDIEIKSMHRAILAALAQHPDGLTKRQILIHTGYASSGPVSSAFADLVKIGAVDAYGTRLTITKTGLNVLGPYDPLPVGDALREWLLTSGKKLSGMEAALLRAICQVHPQSIRKADVLTETGYASSGPVSSAFAKLVGLGYVVSQGPSLVRAAEELFG